MARRAAVFAAAVCVAASCSSSEQAASTFMSATVASTTGSGGAATTSTTSFGGSGPATTSSTGSAGGSSARGFPSGGPWVSFYGDPNGIDLAKVASKFRVINIDADPDGGHTDAGIQTLKNGGMNRVISYLNVGSCEMFRSYYDADPPGHSSCVSSGALTTDYQGYPDEKWANLSNPAYHDLIVNYVAPRLAARGIDGFFLDNLEVVEHAPNDTNGPCDAACSQGGLDLVYELRQKFPNLLIVMQNATSDVTRMGMSHGSPYPPLLDGVSHEEVYSAGADPGSRMEMLAWKSLGLSVNGRPFWLAAEDYVGACSSADKPAADAIYGEAMMDGLNEYVTDASAMQAGPCYWDEL